MQLSKRKLQKWFIVSLNVFKMVLLNALKYIYIYQYLISTAPGEKILEMCSTYIKYTSCNVLSNFVRKWDALCSLHNIKINIMIELCHYYSLAMLAKLLRIFYAIFTFVQYLFFQLYFKIPIPAFPFHTSSLFFDTRRESSMHKTWFLRTKLYWIVILWPYTAQANLQSKKDSL